MRYRVEGIEASKNFATADDLYLFTVILGLLIGLVLTWLGVKGRQIWLTVSSGGLVVASITYIVWVTWLAG